MNAHRPYPTQRAAELQVEYLRERARVAERFARAAREADATGHAATWERDAADCRDRARVLEAQMAAHEAAA